MTKVVPIRSAPAADNKCSRCRGSVCCTYITQQIDAPRSIADFDLLLWQLSHRDVALFKDDDGWFLQVMNACTHLQPDGRCGIYETRPQICRDHSTDNCEFGGLGPDDHDLFFTGYAELLTYCRKRFKNWDRRFNTSDRKAGVK